jgi:hypothetical protein
VAPERSRPVQLQQTRFQRELVGLSSSLTSWADNPWRRLSLQLIVLLMAFSIGGAVGSITGALAKFDPIGALVCVAAMELAIRLRGQLRRQPGDKLGLQLLDMARIGLLYGLMLDGFKLM